MIQVSICLLLVTQAILAVKTFTSSCGLSGTNNDTQYPFRGIRSCSRLLQTSNVNNNNNNNNIIIKLIVQDRSQVLSPAGGSSINPAIATITVDSNTNPVEQPQSKNEIVNSAGPLLTIPNSQASSISLSNIQSEQIKFQGDSTYFDITDPRAIGNCGIELSQEESKYIVGLKNGQNQGENVDGTYNSGNNCGRWVKVTLGQKCSDDSQQINCSRASDQFTGLSFNAIVFDSMVQNQFNNPINIRKLALDDLGFSNYDNRQVSWGFIDAPKYQGDIKISFGAGTSKWWPMILVTNLKTGVSRIERAVKNGSQKVWTNSKKNGNVGQQIILPVDSQNTQYELKIYDSNDRQYQGIYTFQMPASCGESCGNITPVTYKKE